MQAALAELDRVWGSPAPTSTPHRDRPPSPEAQGCVVVVDLARDGRRFAGRRARTVIGAVAGRLADRLPDGARLREDDSDALSVVLPGWDRASATGWMHRTLPGLLEGFVSAEDLPGAQLRVSVHDADGPVGAQLLQRLDTPPFRNGASALATRPGGPGRDAVPAVETTAETPPVRAAGPLDTPADGNTAQDRGTVQDRNGAPDRNGGPDRDPGGAAAAPEPGRHGAGHRTPFRVTDESAGPGRGGRRRRRIDDDLLPGSSAGPPARDQAEPTVRRQDEPPVRDQADPAVPHRDEPPVRDQGGLPVRHQGGLPVRHGGEPPVRHRDEPSVGHHDGLPVREQVEPPARDQGGPGNEGGQAVRDQDGPADAERPEGPAPAGTGDARGAGTRSRPPASTDGLGLADLLAGALAAYRSI